MEYRGIKAPSLSNELRIVANCCRWPPSCERSAAIRSACQARFSWDLLMRIAARHRVEGLVADGIRRAAISAPDEVQQQLARNQSSIALQNISMASETLRLQHAAEEAGIKMIVLKGVTLNVLAYGTHALKRAWDIDLLVSDEQRKSACELLISQGYDRVSPSPDLPEEQADLWMRSIKESVWFHAGRSLAVELHTALTDSAHNLPGLGVNSPFQQLEIAPGRTVQTLPDSELFAYLCVHGATHGWSRLKWLADLAAFLNAGKGRDAEQLHREALALGAGRSSAQALILCSELLATRLPEKFFQELKQDPVTRWLVRVALRTMTGPDQAKELNESVLGTARIQLSHFFLQRGLQYKRSELKRKLSTPSVAVVTAPKGVSFLTPAFSILNWLVRRSRTKRHKVTATWKSN